MTSERETGAGAVTWAWLTPSQRAALIRVSKGIDAIGYYPQLLNMGLIATIDNVELGFESGFVLTDLGKRVLASAPAAVTEAAPAGDDAVIDDIFPLQPKGYITIDARDELAALRARVADLEAENGRLKTALNEINAEARDAQGDWGGVDPLYQPVHIHPLSTIEDMAAKALDPAGAKPESEA